MHPALKYIDHRPWPIPKRPWPWRQSWCHLLFAHWQVPAELLRPLVPKQLTLEADGQLAWVGVVPFKMVDVAPRGWPTLPWLSHFPEINLRIYVTYDGKPGVWFLSLDATQPIAVWAARRMFHLPYHHASIAMRQENGIWHVNSKRKKGAPHVTFSGSYQPTSPVFTAEPGTIEHKLTERYCLYAQAPNGQLFRTQVHHAPWPLQQARADLDAAPLAAPFDMPLTGDPLLLHYAERIDVIAWSPEPLGKI